MTKTSKIIYFFIAICFFILFDLYFSEIVLENLRYSIDENPILDIVFVQNTGAAFSILANSQLFLIVFSIIAMLYLIIFTLKNIKSFSNFAIYWMSILLAGITCNLYERLAFGYVRDFFKLNFVDFPIFNISDVFINISVIALIIIIIKSKYLRK